MTEIILQKLLKFGTQSAGQAIDCFVCVCEFNRRIYGVLHFFNRWLADAHTVFHTFDIILTRIFFLSLSFIITLFWHYKRSINCY